MRRGEVWWTEFDPSVGAEIKKRRPAVVLTVDGLNQSRLTVVMVPLSTGPPPRPPIRVAVPSAGSRSVAVCDQLRARDKSKLIRLQGLLDAADLAAIEDGVRAVLGLA